MDPSIEVVLIFYTFASYVAHGVILVSIMETNKWTWNKPEAVPFIARLILSALVAPISLPIWLVCKAMSNPSKEKPKLVLCPECKKECEKGVYR